MAQPIRDRFITIKGLKTNYVKVGEGPKHLLILPGGAGPVHLYLWIVNKRLYHEYTSYFLNPPGFGRSAKTAKPWGVEYATEFIDEFIERLQLKNITVFGHSMGGAMAAVYAATFPQKIQKLILCSPLGFSPYKFTAQRLFGIFRNKFTDKQYRYLLHRLTFKYGPLMILRLLSPCMLYTFMLWTKTDFRKYFEALKCPTVLIWGDKDDSGGTSFDNFYISQKIIPNCTPIKVSGSRHSLPITEPKKFQTILLANIGFLQSS